MEFNIGRVRFRVGFTFAAAVTVLLLMDESGVCALGLAACVLHECGHLLFMLAVGERPTAVELSYFGMRIEKDGVPGREIAEIIAAAGGPAVNFAAAALLGLADRTGGFELRTAMAINLCIGAFNLIPCLPLDAGRILLFSLCSAFGEERAAAVTDTVTRILLVPMTAAGAALLSVRGNFTLLAVSVYAAADLWRRRRK